MGNLLRLDMHFRASTLDFVFCGGILEDLIYMVYQTHSVLQSYFNRGSIWPRFGVARSSLPISNFFNGSFCLAIKRLSYSLFVSWLRHLLFKGVRKNYILFDF